MTPWIRRALSVVAVGLVTGLAGCQQNTVRPDSGGADATGQLGTVKRSSPADLYVELALGYLRERQYAEALKNAKKATLIDPHNANGFTILGVVYQQLGESGQAAKAFKSAIAADPRDPYALNAYGSFLCGAKEYAEADEMFGRAVSNPLYQTPWVAQTNAGICAYDAGDKAKAETYLRRALQARNDFAPALLRMAQISFEGGNTLSARAYLQRYEAAAEHTAESLWLGIQTERALGDKDQAASYALLLRSKFPDSEQVRLLNDSRAP